MTVESPEKDVKIPERQRKTRMTKEGKRGVSHITDLKTGFEGHTDP